MSRYDAKKLVWAMQTAAFALRNTAYPPNTRTGLAYQIQESKGKFRTLMRKLLRNNNT